MTPPGSPVPPSPKRRRLPTSSRATSSTQTPSTLGNVSNDILFDILSRVPVKSACRLRCVSSEWCTLISKPDFLAAHRSRARHVEPLVAVFSFHQEPSKLGADLRLLDTDGNVVREIKIKDGGGSRKIIGPDLICVADGHYSGACVVDPTTGEVLWTRSRFRVSPSPPHLWRDINRNPKLTFGFGRAIPSGEYKLVCLVDSKSCQVLNVRDGVGWTNAPPPPTRVRYGWNSMAVANGILHVLASHDIDLNIIHCFDLESENWKKTIEGPEKVVGHQLWKKTTTAVGIAELKGSVCIAQAEAQVTNIWLLTDSDNWVKTYTIPMAPKTYLYMPLGMTPDGGKLLFRCSSYYTPAEVVRIYDLSTNTCKDVTKTSATRGHRSRLSLCNLHLDSFISARMP
ncbi:F-box protein At5g18160-like [Lolium perenne]|uniref:F-box protein At5g18160-like n=1 Tax=Lolium perenne TaxID=4522 RepID=UPI0021F5B156|nr:putative F-box protein At3g52320 [Lolium perenne]